MISPGVYQVNVCASESPWMWGGSVQVRVNINGVIDSIVTHASTNCDAPRGKGSKLFAADCGCGGSCSLTGGWEVTYKR